MGFVLAEKGDRLGQALKYCQKAVSAQPSNPAYLDSLGWVYHKLGRRKEALEHLRKAALIAPDRRGIKEHLRVVLDATG
jgi:tetratricopeptide (TPR) repeat protein